MDSRTDTSSSGRFAGQWAFLTSPSRQAQPRSLPQTSSYLRGDNSNVSPFLHIQQLNVSRSSLSRNAKTRSVGGQSTTTIPSQPVLVRVHSASASIQIHPETRPKKLKENMSKDRELPAIHEYSIRGILAAVHEEVEDDVNAISEILGRSRLVLADEHENHLPPQGEIRAAQNQLQVVAEASASNEILASADDVLILADDASLVADSQTGSFAFGLLERMQVHQRSRSGMSDAVGQRSSRPLSTFNGNPSSPEIAYAAGQVHDRATTAAAAQSSRRLLPNQLRQSQDVQSLSRSTNPVVSETYVSPGADSGTVLTPSPLSGDVHTYTLYGYDENELLGDSPLPPSLTRRTFLDRLWSLIPTEDISRLFSWRQGRNERVVTAESQLRDIMYRQEQRRQ
ncbi:hypothetical protein PV08_02356 [Exophiala spinifera]|uniref:Uncharacterized protein n=1 Tax=Exophiala spinifera TaxID=91928 RepID=A0A0D2C397_9EURO|nr:uncharacterized protein PV08_02356 [Exophiala spinifera]KIW18069.1 hypothetical protein PV08_02356 [Exophiala spinifera]